MTATAPRRTRRLPWARSLRLRLLAATLVALVVALALAGVLLAGLFKDHVLRQFSDTLRAQLDGLTARLEFDAAGQPLLDAATLTDPRWSRPYSGWYWQVDGDTGTPRRGVLRSRSLWDATLEVDDDALAEGEVHVHERPGPDGARLLVVERTVRPEGAGAARWRVLVAADQRDMAAAVARFNGVLALSLAVLLALLCAAAIAQVRVGLAPLRELQRSLAAVHQGRSAHIEGRFPAELQPLVDDFNAVLAHDAEVVARARTQAGNLAHAIKTPLAALSQAAASAATQDAAARELPRLVQEQVAAARRQVDWQLARSRAAAAQGVPGARVALAPVLDGLLRVMRRVHAERGLVFACAPVDPALAFAGELQDLQELLGNLLDNAGKWARHEVTIRAERIGSHDPGRLHVLIDDDGPGIAADHRDAVMQRGARLDESVPGSGLGLAIVQDLAGLYGGQVALDRSPAGGLRVELRLPLAPGDRTLLSRS